MLICKAAFLAEIGSDGTFTLDASGGEWEIMIDPPWEGGADWQYTGRPKRARFKDDITISSISSKPSGTRHSRRLWHQQVGSGESVPAEESVPA